MHCTSSLRCFSHQARKDMRPGCTALVASTSLRLINGSLWSLQRPAGSRLARPSSLQSAFGAPATPRRSARGEPPRGGRGTPRSAARPPPQRAHSPVPPPHLKYASMLTTSAAARRGTPPSQWIMRCRAASRSRTRSGRQRAWCPGRGVRQARASVRGCPSDSRLVSTRPHSRSGALP